ncbi:MULTISPECIES: BglG family transcription antiterminator LicT [Enterococcus]|uniref:BglG family transcription antiterminator LicT n=1 Tax=Enterococcus TaxID=1350 RepID=UPI00065E1529|nr:MULTISPECIES: PRD domain-containing protein [Enterococcus]KAF1302332.1 transcription antiterminator LicT [Enterococcus sp. JM9B]
MRIEKILNNNVIVSRDNENNEIIAMGRGLAFNKRAGDLIPAEKIDKVFRLTNTSTAQKFQELLNDIPIEYLALADEIIEYAKSSLEISLNESVYVSLTDHLYTAIERSKNNISVPNILLWDIKRLFPKEFQVGKKATEKISEYYQVQLSEDEAGFIALHLVNGQTEEGQEDMYAFTKTLQDIINIVRYYFKIDFDEESVYFYRFTTHLRFFLSRVTSQTIHDGEVEEELLQIVTKKYSNALRCVEKIDQFLADKYSYTMSSDEKMYLTIHIARLVQKSR